MNPFVREKLYIVTTGEETITVYPVFDWDAQLDLSIHGTAEVTFRGSTNPEARRSHRRANKYIPITDSEIMNVIEEVENNV